LVEVKSNPMVREEKKYKKAEDGELDFLQSVLLPDEGAKKGVFVFSEPGRGDFFVPHSRLSREERIQKFRIKLPVRRAGHNRSPHLLDLKKMLEEVRRKQAVEMMKGEDGRAPVILPERAAIQKPFFFRVKFAAEKWFRTIPRFEFRSAPAMYRGLLGFVILCFIFILPIKALTYYGTLVRLQDRAVTAGQTGLAHFESGSRATAGLDFNYAIGEFGDAAAEFGTAENSLGQAGAVLGRLVEALPIAGQFYQFGKDVASLGENLSLAALDLTRGLAVFRGEDNWLVRITNLKNYLEAALPRLSIAENLLSSLKDNLREPLTKEKWELLNSVVAAAKAGVGEMSEMSDLLAGLLGKDGEKRYLLIFQNSNELRATGGFMGSFAVLDVSRGEIKNLEIPGGGTYDLKGQLRELVKPPAPLRLIASQWQFQDANWWPDFPTSAKKIMWFYEKSGGGTVDGVIAVNSTLLPRLLKFTGPIEMPEYGKTISSENFMDETEKYVELEYDKTENKPKQIIADLAPKLIERLKNVPAAELGEFFSTLSGAMRSKDVQIYLTDAAAEEKIGLLGLGGELADVPSGTDYLLVADTNIAGQKTDGLIDELIDETIDVAPDGTIDKILKITRAHHGIKGTLFSGVRNVDYMRIYVPEGSILLGANGFIAPSSTLFKTPPNAAVDDADLSVIETEYFIDPLTGTRVGAEFGKTVFGNWLMVDPGQSAAVTVKYRLPFKFSAISPEGFLAKASSFVNPVELFSYKYLVQKQSGAEKTVFKSRLILPKVFSPLARYPNGLASDGGGWRVEEELTGDKFFGILLGENR